MDEQKLRAWLAKRLKAPGVPSPLWSDLAEEGYVREALEGGREEREDLARVARRRLGLARALGGRGAGPRAIPIVLRRPSVGAYETERALATAETVALEAAREPRVRRFRRLLLGDRPLAVPEARRLLASPAAQFLTPEAFAARGIPIVGHRSEIIDRTSHPSDDGLVTMEVALRMTGPGGEHEERVDRTWDPALSGPPLRLAFLDETGEHFEAEVWPRAVLDHLRELAEWLAKWYGWAEDAAAWFVLTDDPPRRPPLAGSIAARDYPTHGECRITFVVEPWVPAAAVLQTYRAVQRDLLGRENRPLGARNLALLRFVVAQERAEERKPESERERLSWAGLMARWNEAHPQALYAKERLFARDTLRARRTVLFPDYRYGAPIEEDVSS